MNPLNLFIPLSKVDVEKREVWGRITQEVLDKSGEIMDYATSKPKFEKWSAEFEKATDGASLGNVREMHGKSAAGKLIKMIFDDASKSIDVGSKIVDDQAWKKVLERVYTGFSVGGSYAKRWQDGSAMRYTAAPAEVSLVDNPCVGTALFYDLVKADGTMEKIALRTDTSPSEGSDFADAKNKKYPLDTAQHVRAAASYFGMPKNRAKYSSADQKTIDGKISAAKKKFGIGQSAEKTLADAIGAAKELGLKKQTGMLLRVYGEASSNGFRKGMFGIAQLASIIQDVANLTQATECEAEFEGDDSELPGKLADLRDALGEVLVEMAEEETAELNPELEEDKPMTTAEKFAKALSLISEAHGELALTKAVSGAEHKEMVQTIHDHTVALGAGHNGQHDEELKQDGYKKDEDKSQKGEKGDKPKESKDEDKTEKMAKSLADAMARIETLEKQPAAAQAARTIAVDKSSDAAELRKAKEEQDRKSPLELIKEASANGKAVTRDELMKLGR